VLVYNSDVAASEQIADYYCAARGIPAANKIPFAMGTGALWAWRSNWHATVITDLYNKCIAVGAKVVLTAAGAPNAIALTNKDGGANVAISLPLFFAQVKALYCTMEEPVAFLGLSGKNFIFSKLNPLIDLRLETPTQSVWDAKSRPTAGQVAVDVGLRSGQTPVPVPEITLEDPARIGLWDASAFLLKGLVGYCTYPDTTHPVDLYAKSVAIIDRATAGEFTLAEARTKQIIVGAAATTGGEISMESDALAVSLLKSNGFTNVLYFVDTSVTLEGLKCLIPAPDFLGAGTAITAVERIQAGLATAQSAWLVFGIAFPNDDAVDDGSDTPAFLVRNGNWDTFLGLASGGVVFVGASYGLGWARWAQVWGSVGGMGSPWNTAHISSSYITRSASIVQALLDGMSLCEAETTMTQLGASMEHSAFGYIIGDPLMRPIITNRQILPSLAPITGSLPNSVTLSAETNATRNTFYTSDVINLTGFSGPVQLTFGATKGYTNIFLNGSDTSEGYNNVWVDGPCTVRLYYRTVDTAGDAATVRLLGNGQQLATWTVTNA
jgi:hypothetical protein